MKKILLFAAAGILTTATFVTATVRSEKKPATKEITVKKEVKEKKEPKCNKAAGMHHCIF
jgi:hypothetical protein